MSIDFILHEEIAIRSDESAGFQDSDITLDLLFTRYLNDSDGVKAELDFGFGVTLDPDLDPRPQPEESSFTPHAPPFLLSLPPVDGRCVVLRRES